MSSATRKRYPFFLAAMILCVFLGETLAVEVFLGEVVTVFPSIRQIEVIPISDEGVSTNGRITVRLVKGELPPCARVGHVVKIWGLFSNEDPNLLLSDRITGIGADPGRSDRTGVRRRLGKDPGFDSGGDPSDGGGSGGSGGGGRGGGSGGGGGGGGRGGRN